MTTIERPRQYRVKGTTDDVTECAYCGRQELKGTVVLEVLDADGTPQGVTYFGTGCAATAGRRTVKEVKAEAKSADRATREALWLEREEATHRFIVARDAWMAANCPAEWADPRRFGTTSVRLVARFCEATGATA